MASGNYEFTESQNQVIGNLAYNMRGVGTTSLMLGLLYFFFGTLLMLKGEAGLVAKVNLPTNAANTQTKDGEKPAAVAEVTSVKLFGRNITTDRIVGMFIFLSGVLYLLLGSWTMGASNPFHAITVTRGNDIRNLMDAMDNLRKLFASLYSMILLFVFAGLAVLIVNVIFIARKGGL